jgi:hypothetical protein
MEPTHDEYRMALTIIRQGPIMQFPTRLTRVILGSGSEIQELLWVGSVIGGFKISGTSIAIVVHDLFDFDTANGC